MAHESNAFQCWHLQVLMLLSWFVRLRFNSFYGEGVFGCGARISMSTSRTRKKEYIVLKSRFFQIRGNQPVALIKLNIRCDSFKGLQRTSDSRLQTFKWTWKQVSWNHDIMIHYGSFFSLASDFFGSDFNFWCHTRTSDSIKVRALNFFGETAASYYALFPVGQVEPRWEVTTAACDVAIAGYLGTRYAWPHPLPTNHAAWSSSVEDV